MSIQNDTRSRGGMWLKSSAVISPVLAVLPIVLGTGGGIWTAMHLVGGATALLILAYCGLSLPSPYRWYTALGVAISIAVISVVTGGGSLGSFVQAAVLTILAVIYVVVVFFPPRVGRPKKTAKSL